MSFKICFIGAGSVGFTRKLLADLLAVPEFSGTEVAFMDINRDNLDMVYQLCQRDIEHNGLDIRIKCHMDRREALSGARYVFNVARIGGLEAFAHDVNIPLKYGVDQCVGDTLCAGGIFYAQRVVPFMLDLCRDIREVAEPGCMLLNYSNPNAMATWAAIKYGGVPTIGLCHGVQGGHALMARALGVPYEDLDIVCAGINHQTWYIKADYKGQDMLPRLKQAMLADEEIARQEKVRIDMIDRFGYFSTESNGHLSEYLPWYRKRIEDIPKWISLDEWIHGETGGYLRECTERRNWFEEDFPRWLAEPPYEYKPENRSLEHGSRIIESLETGCIYRGHFNVMNNGCIKNLPEECVVEVPGYVDATGVNIPVIGDLPLGCAAVISQSIWVQRLGMEAAAAGDIALLRQAMMLDPLVGAVCDPNEIWQMTDEMLVALAEWMPQYADEVGRAKQRLKDHYVKPRYEGFEGAARLKVKSVDELKSAKGATIHVEDKALGVKKE